jgi:hypothetical protein
MIGKITEPRGVSALRDSFITLYGPDIPAPPSPSVNSLIFAAPPGVTASSCQHRRSLREPPVLCAC